MIKNVSLSVCLSRTPSCPSLYGTISSTFSGRLSASLKTSTSRTLNVSNWLNNRFQFLLEAHVSLYWFFWSVNRLSSVCSPMNRPRPNVTVRREIDSLNERLTGDGQASEGGDPTKGALKTKGMLFSMQPVSCLSWCGLLNEINSVILLGAWKMLLEKQHLHF